MTDYSPEQILVNGVVLFAIGCAVTPLSAAAVRHLFPERVVFFARWGFSHVALLILGAYAVALLTKLAVGGLVDQEDALQLLAAGLIPFAAICGLIVYFANRLHPESWRALGMQPRHHGRAVLAGLSTYAMLFPLLLGAGLIWKWLWPLLGGVAEPQEIAKLLAALPPDRLLWAAVIAVVLQPLLEEVIFRGFLQPLFIQNFGAIGGIGATSFLFAALHGGAAFLQIFVLSAVIGAVMLRTQRLTAAWAIHALNNGLMIAVLAWSPESLDLVQ